MLGEMVYTLKWWIFGIVLVAIALGAWFVAYPLIVRQETYAAHQSYGYGQTQANQLILWMQDYQRLQTQIDSGVDATTATNLRAEQRSDIARMRGQVALMNPADVPPTVTQFLIGKAS